MYSVVVQQVHCHDAISPRTHNKTEAASSVPQSRAVTSIFPFSQYRQPAQNHNCKVTAGERSP